jgi:pimeloyl-ACP methyl ester carboxylesterase
MGSLTIEHLGTKMAPCVALLAAVATLGGNGNSAPLLRMGSDLSRGVLVNHSFGSRPSDPPDASRPTVVFIHGFNPMPRTVHFTMAERFAEALARRGGPTFNMLGWQWNGASFDSLNQRANSKNAIEQGRLLADALLRAGVTPSRTHAIGHSSGCIVAASAARTLAVERGQPLAQLTLLDPATLYHDVVFERLAAGSAAPIVENYWASGPSGYGKHVPYAGVRNLRVAGPTPYLGVIAPLRSDHLHIVRWYLATIEDRSYPAGFNTSPLLGTPS